MILFVHSSAMYHFYYQGPISGKSCIMHAMDIICMKGSPCKKKVIIQLKLLHL